MHRNSSYKLPRSLAPRIVAEAMLVAESVRCDELDCSQSWARQPTGKTPAEVYEIGKSRSDTHWTFIRKKDFPEEYFDVGLSTIGVTPTYFLWVRLSIDTGEKLIAKYELRPAHV